MNKIVMAKQSSCHLDLFINREKGGKREKERKKERERKERKVKRKRRGREVEERRGKSALIGGSTGVY
jgi:hypothetical protein